MKPILIATMKTTLIYGTAASPFAKLPWGRCTRKPGILYLHVFDWPQDGRLVVPGLKSSVRSARLLAGGKPLRVESKGNDKLIHLPASASDPVASALTFLILLLLAPLPMRAYDFYQPQVKHT